MIFIFQKPFIALVGKKNISGDIVEKKRFTTYLLGELCKLPFLPQLNKKISDVMCLLLERKHYSLFL